MFEANTSSLFQTIQILQTLIEAGMGMGNKDIGLQQLSALFGCWNDPNNLNQRWTLFLVDTIISNPSEVLQGPVMEVSTLSRDLTFSREVAIDRFLDDPSFASRVDNLSLTVVIISPSTTLQMVPRVKEHSPILVYIHKLHRDHLCSAKGYRSMIATCR